MMETNQAGRDERGELREEVGVPDEHGLLREVHSLGHHHHVVLHAEGQRVVVAEEEIARQVGHGEQRQRLLFLLLRMR